MPSYLEDGTEVEVVERFATGVVVQQVHVGHDDSGDWLGDSFIVKAVFDEPPIAKRAAVIVEQEAKIKELLERRRELEAEERTFAERRKKLASYPSLEMLEDALEGRLTHYAIDKQYGDYQILPIAESFCEGSSKGDYDRPIRLLSLFGKRVDRHTSKAVLAWRLHRYSDGSGGGHVDVFPCTSYEQAQQKLQAMIDAAWDADPRVHVAQRILKAAQSYGLVIPDGVEGLVKEQELNNAKAAVAERQKALAEAEARLLEIEQAHS
jgi:hypothetical protein